MPIDSINRLSESGSIATASDTIASLRLRKALHLAHFRAVHAVYVE
jgi:hypothetical protein